MRSGREWQNDQACGDGESRFYTALVGQQLLLAVAALALSLWRPLTEPPLPAACCPWRSLGSPAAAVLLLTGCLWYYSGRTRLEEAILDGAFGERYRQYRHSTGRFLPRLLR